MVYAQGPGKSRKDRSSTANGQDVCRAGTRWAGREVQVVVLEGLRGQYLIGEETCQPACSLECTHTRGQ